MSAQKFMANQPQVVNISVKVVSYELETHLFQPKINEAKEQTLMFKLLYWQWNMLKNN